MGFFVIHLKFRAVEVAGIPRAPDGDWMKQLAGNLLDPMHGFLRRTNFLVHDRDPVFTSAWTALLRSGGVQTVPTPRMSRTIASATPSTAHIGSHTHTHKTRAESRMPLWYAGAVSGTAFSPAVGTSG